MNFSKRLFVSAGLAALVAACGGGSSKFRRYSGPRITQVHVQKGKRRLHLISGRKVIKSYKISLGGAPAGPKRFEGDGKTPEGIYIIDRQNPNSSYHLSIGISYPNTNDAAYAAAFGRRPGGDIFIHGQAGKDGGRSDWTAGCIAVTDDEIEEIYSMVTVGTPIVITP